MQRPNKTHCGNYSWQSFFNKLPLHEYFIIPYSDTGAAENAFRRWKNKTGKACALYIRRVENNQAKLAILPSSHIPSGYRAIYRV